MDNKIRLPENVMAFAHLELQKMSDEVEGIKAVVLATEDGFDVASVVRDGSDPSRIAAMASSISAISTVVSEEAKLGQSKNIIINTVSGFAVMQSIVRDDARLVLNAIANEKAVLAHVLYRTSHFADSLTTL